ncbi:hypothetical protein RHS01_00538 [Rhizoctonia solani]|uniref:Uncharacterized protein n=1 Tax=Rhizoctonia solani TaxID=456999 RepID=A0A8H7M5M4_9AGAM|nr:hypothetical protein RHS01_00538 [Rhizoctonia solani]
MLSERRPPTVNSRVSAFLESQHGLMSYYAAEGKAVTATWPKQSSRDLRVGSPILVPRAATAKGNDICTTLNREAPDETVPACRIDTDKSSADPMAVLPKSNPVKSPKSARVAPSKSMNPPRKSVGRDQGSDDEPERLQRLEQRRNRRRARRYAMDVAEGATNRRDDASEIDLSCKVSKRQKLQPEDKTSKKKERVKNAPALLLMQKFSSQNLGKSRLTVNLGAAKPNPQRACREKDRALKSSQHSSTKALMNRVARPGSPTGSSSSRSVREHHLPGPSKKPRFQLRNSCQRVSTAPVNTDPNPRSFPPHPPAQTRTTSAYFASMVTQEQSQLSTAPLSELDGAEDKRTSRKKIYRTSGSLYSGNPPSTPECLQQSKWTQFPSPLETTCMHGLDTTFPGNNTIYAQFCPLPGSFQEGSAHNEWRTEEIESQEGMSYGVLEPAEYMEQPSGCGWNGPGIPNQDKWIPSHGAFSIDEDEDYEIHSDTLGKDTPFYAGAQVLNEDTGYSYEDTEFVHEDTDYLDQSMEADHMFRQDVDDLGYIDYEDDFSEGYNAYMEPAREHALYNPSKWCANDLVESVDPICIEPEPDTLDQSEIAEAEDEWAEQAPRLLHVITEESLQDDLIRSMNGHWNAAHRLY